MNFDIEAYIANLQDEKKKKRLLNYCFNKDLECKKNGFYPNLIIIFHKKLTKQQVLYLSNLYLDYYATVKEKELYFLIQDRFLMTLSNNLKNTYQDLKKAFYIYLEKGVFSQAFLKLVIEFKCDIEYLLEYPINYNMMFATKEERELYKNCKNDVISRNNIDSFYYKLCSMCDWDYTIIIQIQLLLNKSSCYLFKKIDSYIAKNLQGKPEEYLNLLREYKFKSYKKNKIRDMFYKLETLEKKEQIVKLLLSTSKSPDELLKELSNYIKNCRFLEFDLEAKNLEEALKQKIMLYKEYYDLLIKSQDEKHQEEKMLLSHAELLISNFLKSSIETEFEFCREINITEAEYQKLISILKKYKSPVYDLYQEKIISKIKIEKEKLLKYFYIMIEQITNGIIENGERREFDILDYFTLFKMPFKPLLDICKNDVDKESLQKFKSFMLKNTKLILITSENIDDILKEKKIFNVEFDSNNLPIPNTGHIVSCEEKLEIINELKKYNMHYYQVYQRALNRKYNIHIKRNIKN